MRQMNLRAAALGLADTHYANPVGLDQRGNYSSARDLATLTRRLLRIPAFARIADSRSAVLRSVRPAAADRDHQRAAAGWRPGSTGSRPATPSAPATSWSARAGARGSELISAAIGAPTDEARFADDLELLDYGFSQYRAGCRSAPARTSPTRRSATRAASCRCGPPAASRSGCAAASGSSVEVDAPAEVEGPIRRGAALGSATVFVDGRRAGSVPLRAGRSIPRASGFDRLAASSRTTRSPSRWRCS